MTRNKRHTRRLPSYTALQVVATFLNILGALAMIGGFAVVIVGMVGAIDGHLSEAILAIASGGMLMSIGLIELGLASGLQALRDIARGINSLAAR